MAACARSCECVCEGVCEGVCEAASEAACDVDADCGCGCDVDCDADADDDAGFNGSGRSKQRVSSGRSARSSTWLSATTSQHRSPSMQPHAPPEREALR
eukprot:6208969-Pleurochrysis_carterae.AAC.3